MGISLSWRMPASTQYLNGYLAELENTGLYAVKLLDLMKDSEEVGAVLQPRALSSLNFFPCNKWTVSRGGGT
jgi:hypothetical protein